MNLTRNRNREIKKKGLQFPLLECWNPMTESAQIVAQLDGRRVMCNIPIKLLHKRFGDALGPIELVIKNRSAIEKAADSVIEAGRFESDGSIILGNEDF
jgi:hypothetical protein